MEKIKRVEWIDIYKGVGILLVVIGHSSIPENFSWWIWSFHMPMFFFISGYLFNPLKHIKLNSFIEARFKTLLTPYLFLTALCLIWFLFLYIAGVYDTKTSEYTKFTLEVIFWGWEGIALWFIPVLFLSELTIFLVVKYANKKLFWVLTASLATLGYYLYLREIHLPYKLEVVPTASLFYGIGFKTNSWFKSINSENRACCIIFFFILLTFANVITCFLNTGQLDMAANKLNNIALTYISAFCGIAVFVLFSIFIDIKLDARNHVRALFIYLGRNTMIILGTHQALKITMHILSSIIPNAMLALALRQSLFIILLFITIKLFNRYLYVFLGKPKLKAKNS